MLDLQVSIEPGSTTTTSFGGGDCSKTLFKVLGKLFPSPSTSKRDCFKLGSLFIKKLPSVTAGVTHPLFGTSFIAGITTATSGAIEDAMATLLVTNV